MRSPFLSSICRDRFYDHRKQIFMDGSSMNFCLIFSESKFLRVDWKYNGVKDRIALRLGHPYYQHCSFTHDQVSIAQASEKPMIYSIFIILLISESFAIIATSEDFSKWNRTQVFFKIRENIYGKSQYRYIRTIVIRKKRERKIDLRIRIKH